MNFLFRILFHCIIGYFVFASANDEILSAHNKARRSVNPLAADMVMLKWSGQAQKYASNTANTCVFKHSSSRSRPGCGENLAMTTDSRSWTKVIQLWADERKNYCYGCPKPLSKVGHYTQMIWAKSTTVGCTVKDCGSFKFYVCVYCPPGNMNGHSRPYKVARRSRS